MSWLGLLLVGIFLTGLAMLRTPARNRQLSLEAGLSVIAIGWAVFALTTHEWPWAAIALVAMGFYVSLSAARLVETPFRSGGPAKHEWQLILWVAIPGIALGSVSLAALFGTRINVIETALAIQCAFAAFGPWSAASFPMTAARFPNIVGVLGLASAAVAGESHGVSCVPSQVSWTLSAPDRCDATGPAR